MWLRVMRGGGPSQEFIKLTQFSHNANYDLATFLLGDLGGPNGIIIMLIGRFYGKYAWASQAEGFS